MIREKWLEVKGRVQDTFSDSTEGVREEGVETIEWIEFKNHEGTQMRLEWHDAPKKLGEKTITSNRIGSDVTIESEYSDTERVQRVVLLVRDSASGEWIEGDAAGLI